MSKPKIRHQATKDSHRNGMSVCGKYIGNTGQYNGPENGKPCARCASGIAMARKKAAVQEAAIAKFQKEPRSIIAVKAGDKILARFRAFDSLCAKQAEAYAKYASKAYDRTIVLWSEPQDMHWIPVGPSVVRYFDRGAEMN